MDANMTAHACSGAGCGTFVAAVECVARGYSTCSNATAEMKAAIGNAIPALCPSG